MECSLARRFLLRSLDLVFGLKSLPIVGVPDSAGVSDSEYTQIPEIHPNMILATIEAYMLIWSGIQKGFVLHPTVTPPFRFMASL